MMGHQGSHGVQDSSRVCRTVPRISLSPPSKCPLLVVTMKPIQRGGTVPWRTTGYVFKLYSKFISQPFKMFQSYSSPVFSCGIWMEDAASERREELPDQLEPRLLCLLLYFQACPAHTRCSTNIGDMKFLAVWP